MTRLLPAAVLLVALGCSNAPIAGTLDAVWPSRTVDREPDRRPVIPSVQPPDVRPITPPSNDVLPPPADPFLGGVKG
ncbi:hypothetical protein [Urbifossiella limnaea]|uniref:hypothetical protein n=1 Tax=Urbifossiella limnaea TaxID=2528023 RepID=UPI0011AA78CE|nr:hypothetical protein [Urbifossiella limnaea]